MKTLKELIQTPDTLSLLQYMGHLPLSKTNKNSLSLAQKTNFWKITVHLYEKWRLRSSSLLSRKALDFEKECEIMQEWIYLKPDDRVLDVGSSTGLYARRLKQYADTKQIPIQMTGIDISPRFVRFANTQTDKDKIKNTRFYVMDTTKLPFKDNIFDKVIIGGSFNELSHYREAIQEWNRILKQGGLLFSMNLVCSGKKNIFMRLLSLSGIHVHTPEQMKVFFEKAGFIQVQSKVFHHLELALYRKI